MRALLRMTLALFALLALPGESHADLGALVADGVAGPYRVSVLVSPAPLRVGRSQWSVLVQDRSGGVVRDAEVELSWGMGGHGAHRITRAARAGSHPFYLSSDVDLPAEASWRVEVSVRSSAGSDALVFDVAVAAGRGPWSAHWPALVAPLLVLGLFALHQSLVLRARRSEA